MSFSKKNRKKYGFKRPFHDGLGSLSKVLGGSILYRGVFSIETQIRLSEDGARSSRHVCPWSFPFLLLDATPLRSTELILGSFEKALSTQTTEEIALCTHATPALRSALARHAGRTSFVGPGCAGRAESNTGRHRPQRAEASPAASRIRQLVVPKS